MCLDVKYSKDKISKLPKEFTAYKIVQKAHGAVFSPMFGTQKAIQPTNVLPVMDFYDPVKGGGRYKPYYHSFRTQAACDAVATGGRWVSSKWAAIKIRVTRKDVTCVGGQSRSGKPPYYQIIVSKAFTTEFEEYIPKKLTAER